MKQKIKKILSLLIIAICSINLGGQTVMAANSSYLMPQKETVFTSDNSVINEYYTEFYAGEKEVMVTDSNGNDVTSNFWIVLYNFTISVILKVLKGSRQLMDTGFIY